MLRTSTTKNSETSVVELYHREVRTARTGRSRRSLDDELSFPEALLVPSGGLYVQSCAESTTPDPPGAASFPIRPRSRGIAPTSGDKAFQSSLAFSSKSAAYFKERYYQESCHGDLTSLPSVQHESSFPDLLDHLTEDGQICYMPLPFSRNRFAVVEECFENCGKRRDAGSHQEAYGRPTALRHRVCRKSREGVATPGKTATISGDNGVEGSLAFNSKNAANSNERHCVTG